MNPNVDKWDVREEEEEESECNVLNLCLLVRVAGLLDAVLRLHVGSAVDMLLMLGVISNVLHVLQTDMRPFSKTFLFFFFSFFYLDLFLVSIAVMLRSLLSEERLIVHIAIER